VTHGGKQQNEVQKNLKAPKSDVNSFLISIEAEDNYDPHEHCEISGCHTQICW